MMIGGGGSGRQNPLTPPNAAGPGGPEGGHRRLDRGPPGPVAGDRPPEGVLFGGVGRGPASPRPEPEQQPAAAHVLEGGGHDAERPGIPVGDVEHHRPDGQAGHGGRDGGQGGPALEHPFLAVHRPGQMVVQPHSVEAFRLGRDRSFPDIGPGGVERVEQQVDLHAPILPLPWAACELDGRVR